MLYFFWGLLNLALFLSFIFACFKATQLLRRQIGMAAAVLFVFGLLSFINYNGKSKAKNPASKDENSFVLSVGADKSLSTRTMNINLEHHTLQDIDLQVMLTTDSNGIERPVSAYCSANGWVSGTNWRPLFVSVQKDAQQQWKYVVTGLMEWTLLGAVVYTEDKRFEGVAPFPLR